MKRALLTGITGQDGSYLAEFLLAKGYEVYGLVRRTSTPRIDRIAHLKDRITFCEGDVLDGVALRQALSETQPDEIYNLAAQSFVGASWSAPLYTANVTGLGVLNVLEAVRQVCPNARFYQASTSEQFGDATESPQNELTPFRPRSPYGCAKVFGHNITVNYRESYGMFACCGICFNHESPRRSEEFVTRKISKAAARISLGLQDRLQLGNAQSERDWGFAGDYVEAMWLMLQADAPKDYVIGTGETHTVMSFASIAFEHVGLSAWDLVDWNAGDCLRPADVASLCADASKIQVDLGWKPTVQFKQLVVMMVDADLQAEAG